VKKKQMIDTAPEALGKERAVLVTVERIGKEVWQLVDRVEELNRLAESSGVEVITNEVARRKDLTPNYLIGKGKVEEIAEIVEDSEADVVIFSNDLSASQQNNLENIVKVKVIDRTQLILDIFAKRATSNEGKVQVELAQLMYLLPRLSRMWLHFQKQRGGIGTRGPGEQQLEVDRRRVRERISKLKQRLDEITKQRELRRRQRERFSMMTMALVGYTNSGKSSLFNLLTEAKVTAKNQLFSTLDPTVRKRVLSNKQVVLFSDTVGFLHELPHHLIESFKATLEEVVDADILIHVLDMSDSRIEEQIGAVKDVLKDLGVDEKPMITVLNKSDKIGNNLEIERIKRHFTDPVVTSALDGSGVEELETVVIEHIQKDMEDVEITVPHKYFAFAKMIQENGSIKEQEYTEEGLFIKARIPKKLKYAIFKQLKLTK